MLRRVSAGSKLCATFLNIEKQFKMIRWGCDSVLVIFSIHLSSVLYHENVASNNQVFSIVIISSFVWL